MEIGNVFVRLLLRSPFHGWLSDNVLLLTYTGRKSGKRYTIPVAYGRVGDVVTGLSLGAQATAFRRGDSAGTVRLPVSHRCARVDT
jgi:hypothetical protein